MKLIIIALVTLACVASPILATACPPPPAPGYDGGEVGTGPTPDESSAPTNPGAGAPTGGDDTGSGETFPEPPSDGSVTYGTVCL
ncbi:MAG: hypothetical protein IT452_16065 [Planctomycetia bacterium]|nr:hypothetical protein [Planctomycetia bacterium]